METYNLHTHTFRCGHAIGDVPDYMEAARTSGYTTLGFSEHTVLPDGKWANVRLQPEKVEEYFSMIRTHQQIEKKRKNGMRILAALECEALKEYLGFYREIKDNYQLDYLIASSHYFPYEGGYITTWEDRFDVQKKIKAHMQAMIDAMESGLFFYLGHPDMFMGAKERWDSYTAGAVKEMMAAAKQYGVPLELNLHGYRKGLVRVGLTLRYQYPFLEFWKLAAEEQVEVVIGVDAHSPRNFMIPHPQLRELLEQCDLRILHEKDILTKLQQKKGE